jgi:hypothetical protein
MNEDFEQGYTNGLHGIDPTSYEGYLSSQISQAWLGERIGEVRADLQTVDQQLAEVRTARKLAFAPLQTHRLAERVTANALDRLMRQRTAIEAEQATLMDRRRAQSPEYSLLAGLFFVVAGLSFLVGDLIISHEIVAYALNIRDTTEAWAFAVGLAMVSILLKPVYDRLVEIPYRQDPVKNRSVYQWFKLTLAGFAVLTLVVLGWFRYEAYRTDQLKSAINRSIRQLQQTTDPQTAAGLDPAVMTRIETQLRQSAELNLALVNSPWALASFVLSGVLFALAGAVCLGIGLPVVSAFWFRWLQADRRLWQLRRRHRRVSAQLPAVEEELSRHLTQQAILQHELDALPDPTELLVRQQDQRDELARLLHEHKLALTDSRIQQHANGYAQGEATRLNPSLSTTSSPTSAPGVGRPTSRLRPHLAFRKLMAEGLSGN